MTNIFIVEHSGDLSGVPEHYETWKAMMPHNTWRLYNHLRQQEYAELGGERVTLNFIANKCALSKTAVIKCLRELEAANFVTVDADEGITYVTVEECPEPSNNMVDALETVGEDHRMSDNRRAIDVINAWANLYRENLSTDYATKPSDRMLAKRLLTQVVGNQNVAVLPSEDEPWIGIRSVSLETIIRVMRFYWGHINEGDLTSFSNFYSNFEEYSAQRVEYMRGFE